MTSSSPHQGGSPWPRRLAVASLWACVPLFLFGGTVTTLRAGMAESGWLKPDGFWLWFYPLDMRLRDVGTFVEHHHREFGSLLGLLTLALFVVTAVVDRRPGAKALAFVPGLFVAVQGTLGGLRVLENDPQLAFVHGAFAQATLGVLVAAAVLLSRPWRAAARAPRVHVPASGAGLPGLAVATVLLVFGQIVVGAWFRHSAATLALILHVALALAVSGLLIALARRLRDASRALEGDGSARLARHGRNLLWLLGVQVGLGLLATVAIYGFSGGMQGHVSRGEMVFATLHVGVGALLLAQCVATAMWARRLCAARAAADEGSERRSLGGAELDLGGAR